MKIALKITDKAHSVELREDGSVALRTPTEGWLLKSLRETREYTDSSYGVVPPGSAKLFKVLIDRARLAVAAIKG